MDNEVALARFGFKGRCKKCGVFDHKAAKCPEKKKGNHANYKKNNKDKIKGECFNCGKESHCAVDYWHKEENMNMCQRNFFTGEISMTEDSADAADVPVIVPMAHECPVSRELEQWQV